MYPTEFEYYRPKTLDEALELMKTVEEPKVIAGGQSLMPMLKLRFYEPACLIDLGAIPELKQVKLDEGGNLRIGAMVTHFEVIENGLIRENAPILASTAENIGDIQIRNRGTIGGSICEADPSADYPPTMFVLEASIVLLSKEGRRTVRIEDFIKGPYETDAREDEIAVEIIVPKSTDQYHVEKYARRKADFAVVSVAAIARTASDGSIEELRIAAGALTDGPERLKSLESALKGKKKDSVDLQTSISETVDALTPISDIHGGEEYRKYSLKMMLARVIKELIE
ncbi:hypothetical protein IX51_03590 [uncultured archaeon]|nr:hypothetical protein IX51_03590 [uncultured archaeon]HKJ96176.1 xanthine dehydrogenase family protein subunit M [Thermoplasmataceae archaeon]